MHRTLLASLCFASIVAASAMVAKDAAAHDFWLEPSEPVLGAAGEVSLSLKVGDHFALEEEKPYEQARMLRFFDRHGPDTTELMSGGTEGSTPFARVRLDGAGGHLLVLERTPARIELEPEKFESYLREEGFSAPLAERASRGEAALSGRERYTRYLKSLVQVGAARDDSYAARVGQVLEIVPEADPIFTAAGAKLPVHVYFQDQPLPGARLVALSRDGADVGETVYVTDAAGEAEITLDRRGLWQLRTVHMIRCDGCADADWQSFWSSYVFSNTAPTNMPIAAAMPRRFGWRVGLALAGATLAVVLAIALVWRGRKKLDTAAG
jgi:uncharacterized GH25 family protein